MKQKKYFEMFCSQKKDIVEFLLNQKAPYEFALLKAAEVNNFEIVDLILKHDNRPSFVNKKTNDGTALLIAVQKNNIQIIKRLLSVPGINADLYDLNKMTPLMIAFDKKLDEIVNLLLDIPRDININLKDEKGIFLLNHFFYMAFIHYVAKSYQYNILPSLFNRQDIDVNIKNSNDILIFCHYIMKLQ